MFNKTWGPFRFQRWSTLELDPFWDLGCSFGKTRLTSPLLALPVFLVNRRELLSRKANWRQANNLPASPRPGEQAGFPVALSQESVCVCVQAEASEFAPTRCAALGSMVILTLSSQREVLAGPRGVWFTCRFCSVLQIQGRWSHGGGRGWGWGQIQVLWIRALSCHLNLWLLSKKENNGIKFATGAMFRVRIWLIEWPENMTAFFVPFFG